jgi:hypothetical protein
MPGVQHAGGAGALRTPLTGKNVIRDVDLYFNKG